MKGNEALKKGLYKSAKHHYTEAMEHKKDLMPLYTNRALAALKLEEPQLAIDDCSRVLEYCEVFDDGYTKQADICYKAFMRRGQALKFQKDFKLAHEDFLEAKKLQKEGETDVDKWMKLNESDREHEEKIGKIMANADSLKGKEYIDYLLAFLKGKKDETAPKQDEKTKKKRTQICFYKFDEEAYTKLSEILKVEEMVYYFNVNDGCKVLVDSLYISTNALPLLQTILDENKKLQDDF